MDADSRRAYGGGVGAVHRMELAGAAPAGVDRPRRVALLGAVVAGVGTSFDNICRVAAADPHLEPVPLPIRPYQGDALERFGRFLPSSVRGTLRSIAGTRPLVTDGPYQAVWTQIDLPLLPWMLTWNAGHRVPVIYAADSTPRLIRSFGVHYGNWGGTSRTKQRMRDALHGMCLRRCAAVTAWSRWAADSMRDDYGVDPSRLHVIPPGVNTTLWAPGAAKNAEAGPARILFVGGDFRRKGGDLLLDVYRRGFRGVAELDMVTRGDAVQPEAGVRVHDGLGANDPKLIQLYREADLFVLPTRADCFSMASLEAMASGLPVITCPVGGVGELFQDGGEGLFVPPDDGQALRAAMDTLISSAGRRRAMGAAARNHAVSAFDAEANTRRIIQLIDSVCAA
ncbi:MAG TPA: glycosyltransferase family 4 protein [Candidatus Limnocylindrales bacterium]|nr:glycosyltransferase family 4 protein [Candidatus Limnocylindrales bacterium]